jgi:CheY-like chemotaxis protein
MNDGQILVVDDDPSILSFVEMALDGEGYSVATASNGAQALAAVSDRPDLDLILLDMRMPVMDGWAFAQAYRSRQGPHAPIVVISAAVDAGKRALEIGADGYLGKPFDLDDLLATAARYIRRT